MKNIVIPSMIVATATMSHLAAADYVGLGYDSIDQGDGLWTM
jgi:hypothetical protein